MLYSTLLRRLALPMLANDTGLHVPCGKHVEQHSVPGPRLTMVSSVLSQRHFACGNSDSKN